IDIISDLGVNCCDAHQIMKTYPVRRPPQRLGWQLKPYAILHSFFEEVIFIDADNVPIRNPEYLFNYPDLRRTGAIFWPDREPLPLYFPGRDTNIWEICALEYISDHSFETGQIVILKDLCWKCLRLTVHLNEHADFYYRYVRGDNDTFQI